MDLQASASLTCALLDDDSVWCWGYHLYTNVSSTTPALLDGFPVPARHITSLHVGETAICARLDNFEAVCTGHLEGIGDVVHQAVPALAGIGDVSLGNGVGCVLDSQGPKCVGSNIDGALGDGSAVTESATSVPVALPSGIANVTALSSANWHSCASLADGTAYCWGENYQGQLGMGSIDGGHAVPVLVQGLQSIKKIAAANSYNCARTTTNISCWGFGFFGQRGDGTAFRSQAQAVLDGEGIFSDGFEAVP